MLNDFYYLFINKNHNYFKMSSSSSTSSCSSASSSTTSYFSMACIYSEKKLNLPRPTSLGTASTSDVSFPNRMANKRVYNYIKIDESPTILVTVTDDGGEKILMRKSYYGTSYSSYTSSELNKMKQFHLSAFYYGSSTRQGDHATVFVPNEGYKKKCISVYFIHNSDEKTQKMIEEYHDGDLVNELPENTEIVFDKVINFNSDNLSDGNFYKFENYMVSFMFRTCHHFNNVVEISAVKIIKFDEETNNFF